MKECQAVPAPNPMLTSLSHATATPRSMTPTPSMDSSLVASTSQQADMASVIDHNDIGVSLVDSTQEVRNFKTLSSF
jgi:hypothetical protein